MGGSSITKPKKGKSYYLTMRSIEPKWLQWKAAELRAISTEKPFAIEKTTFRWRSLCYPILSEMREKFYRDGKRHIDVDIISGIDATGLAVWFADCGKLQHGQVLFNTHVFGENNTGKIAEYFDLCGWEVVIVKERGWFRIRFSEESSKKVIQMIDPFLPIFKLEELYGYKKINKA